VTASAKAIAGAHASSSSSSSSATGLAALSRFGYRSVDLDPLLFEEARAQALRHDDRQSASSAAGSTRPGVTASAPISTAPTVAAAFVTAEGPGFTGAP